MKFISNYKYNLILAGFILLLFFLNAYNLTFNYKPTLAHQWRQSDCLSIAKNYYEEGMNFFQPKIHWQGTKGGRAVSELPILNFTVAALWKVFGQSEGIYRLFNYLIYVLAIFILYSTFNILNKSRLLTFFLVSLLLTSPLLCYYSYNFLSDVPAFSLAIISFCLFFKFYYHRKAWLFYLSLAIGALAVFLKASAAVPIIVITLFSLADFLNLNKKLKTPKLFNRRVLPAVSILAMYILIILWYGFARHYNVANNSGVFLLDVLPVWDMTEKDILKNLRDLLSDLLPIFFNRPVLFIFVISSIYVWFNLKQLDSLLKYAFIISFTSFILFIVLFFKVFDVHDYYLVNMMILPVITFLCLAKILETKTILVTRHRWVVTSLIIIIVFNSFYSAAFYRLRTIKDDKICYWYPFFSTIETKYHTGDMWMYSKTMALLGTVTADLRKLGIKRDDLFISVPDVSPNSSLYLMDQKGYTLSPDEFSKDTTWKSRCHFYDCKYFVISDTVFRDSLSFKLIATDLERVFKKERVEVYKIKKPANAF